MKRREKEFRERKREKPRERSIWKERVHREMRVLRVRRGGRRRGSRVAKMPQTRGSKPAFKSGREENADAVVGSASR